MLCGQWQMVDIADVDVAHVTPIHYFPLLGDKSASSQIRANHELHPFAWSRDRYVA
jgi:hypothetical protein